MITIEHTHGEGTLLSGSHKGDGVWEVVRRLGWRSSRNVGLYVRGSRDKDANRPLIDRTAEALRAAGFEVDVKIDNTFRPTAVREADRTARADDRAERLDGYAANAARRSDAAHNAARRVLDQIPMGQPLLVDHYSYRGDLRRRQRAWANMDKAIIENGNATRLAERAGAVEANQEHRHDPRVTMRRVARLNTELRDARRRLGEATTDGYREQLRERITRLEEEIGHWQGQLREEAEAGTFVPWGREHFRKGDLVYSGGMWHKVRLVNRLSVSVPWIISAMDGNESAHNDTIKWDRIGGRRRDGMQLDAPGDTEWPVELAVKVAKWRKLVHVAGLPSCDHQERRNVRWAQRLAHGLDLDATDAEVAAREPHEDDADARRHLAAAYLLVYGYLHGGITVPQIKADGPVWSPDTLPL